MDNRIELVTRRLKRLERSNRMLKVLAAVAFAVLIGFSRLPTPSATSAAPKTFSAQQFVLVDGAGTALATLGAGPHGGAVLTFFDSQGKRVIGVGAFDGNNGDGLAFYDGNTFVPSANPRYRGSVGISTSGVGGNVAGPNGAFRVGWGSATDGSAPGFATYDQNGVIRTASLNTASSNSSGIAGHIVYDSNGAARSGVDVNVVEGVPHTGFFTNDADGINRAFLGAGLDGSYTILVLNDAAGGTAAQAIDYVTGDGSFSGSFIRDVNNFDRVLSFQQGADQGVATWDSTGTLVPGTSPDGFLP